jgi:hypothetical protein
MRLNGLVQGLTWHRPGLIYVPAPDAEPRVPYLRAHLSHEEVYGRPMGERELIGRVREISRSAALIMLGRLMTATSVGSFADRRFQLGLVREMFGRLTAAHIEDLLQRDPNRLAIGPQQPMALVKVALVHGREMGYGAPQLTAAQQELPRLLLGIADVLNECSIREGEQEGGSEASESAWLLRELVRNMAFHDMPDYFGALARYSQMFATFARDGASCRSRNWIDLDALFTKWVGCSVEEYLTYGAALSSFYMQKDGRIDPTTACVSLAQWLRNVRPGDARAKFETVIREISRPAWRFAQAFRRRSGLPFYYDFVPLEETALVSIPGGRLCCEWPQWLWETLSSGVYWRFHGRLWHCDRSLFNRFCRFAGELFERYVQALLASVLPNDAVFGEQEYACGKQRKRSSDAIVFDGRDAVFFEAGTVHLHKNATEIDAATDALDKDLNELAAKAAQCMSSIRDFQDRRFRCGRFAAPDVDRYWPVVVTLHHLPLVRPVQELLRQKAAVRESAPPDTESPVFVGVDELEWLCSAYGSRKTLVGLLRAWRDDPLHRDWPLTNFLYAGRLAGKRPAMIEGECRRLFGLAEHTLSA